jgi:glycosyltransferase involved in cell wall biosynthesis
MESMRRDVLINGKWRTHGRITGVQRYACDLSEALRELGVEFDEVCPDSEKLWRTMLWEQRTLPTLARGYGTLICPANVAPWRVQSSVRLILTVHCLRFYFHPENYARSFVRWYRFMMPKAIARADTILAVSQTTAREIEEVYPQAKGKISVVYPGVSSAFTNEGVAGDEAIPHGAYWVFVGNAGVTKNLQTLLEVFDRFDHPERLVLLGVDAAGLASIGTRYDPDRVIALGHLNDTNRVAAIYRGAMGLLAPSRYESFDLPTAEAMACGCPVIASDNGVHREILRDAAMFVDADDVDGWNGAMDRVGSELGCAARMRDAGFDRVGEFSWSQAARRVHELIEVQREELIAR